jgi:hypothetical protein
MLVELNCAGETTQADLKDGVVRVGGGAADEIRIAGLKPALVSLRIEGERLTLTASATLSIGKSLVAAHVPRLVVAGELVQLTPLVSLKQVPPARRNKGTATVMRELLRGDLAVEETRAPTLTCLTGADAGNVIPIAFEQLLLGRGDDCTIQIRDRAVSRRHAQIVQRDGRYWLEHLRGANGTFVNGQSVLRKAALRPGDVLELGQTLLRFDFPEIPMPPPPPVPTPPSVIIEEKITEPDVRPIEAPSAQWMALSVVSGAVAVVVAAAAAIVALF